MENEKILLLRVPIELIRKVKGYKYLPLPLVDDMPSNIGLCAFDGMRQLLKVSKGNYGQSCDIQEEAIAYNKAEFYRLIGTSKKATIASIKQASTEYCISPCWFDFYPRFDGEITITTTDHVVVNNWLNYKPVVRLPQPKPNYSGLLDRALQEI